MRVKGIVQEDFVNYKIPSMFIATNICNWKCCLEQGLNISICQNQSTIQQPDIDFFPQEVYNMYISNDISEAIVFGGLEPILQFGDMMEIIKYFREHGCEDDVVVYTGYYPSEISNEIKILKQYKNIIMKFGRYMPNNSPHYDDVLGVKLISDNQYGMKIS